MKKELLSLAAMVFVAAGSVQAQKDTAHIREHRIIEKQKRLNDSKPEKMVIVIDGGKMTINGEEVKGMNNLPMLDGRLKFNLEDLQALAPQMQEMFKSFGPQMQNGHRNFNFTTHSNKAMLGVNVEKNELGAKVTEVVKESAAEKIGLKKDDIITAIDADKINDGDALVKSIGKYKPEDVVDVTILRSGKEKKFKATLGKSDAATGSFNWNGNEDFAFRNAPHGPRVFNFNSDELNRFSAAERPKFGFGIKDYENGDGAVVTNIKEESSAAKAGLKEEDIITDAAGQTIKTTDDLKRVLAENRSQSEVELKVLRSGKSKSLTLKVPKKIKTAEL